MPAPQFKQVQKRYQDILDTRPKEIPGRDFLYSIAYNFDTEYLNAHHMFWQTLLKVFPFEEYRSKLTMPDLDNNLTYLESVHYMFSKMRKQKSLQSVRQQLAYYKSGCTKNTNKGKTCKKVGSRYTKNRDRNRTYRLTHSRLL